MCLHTKILQHPFPKIDTLTYLKLLYHGLIQYLSSLWVERPNLSQTTKCDKYTDPELSTLKCY